MIESNLLWIIAILQIFTFFIIAYSAKKLKSLKLDFTKSTLYKELYYIKALLVAMTIVLVFLGWNIQSNIVKKLTEDMKNELQAEIGKIKEKYNKDLQVFMDQLKNEYGVQLSQIIQASEKGNIVEIPLETLKEEIYRDFNELKDINDKPINNGKDFKNIPIVSLNYVGQPYTITEVTNEGFTVKKLAIFEGYKIGEMGPPSYDENKLIIWIISRD